MMQGSGRSALPPSPFLVAFSPPHSPALRPMPGLGLRSWRALQFLQALLWPVQWLRVWQLPLSARGYQESENARPETVFQKVVFRRDRTLYYSKNYFDISFKLFAPKCAGKALLPTPHRKCIENAKGAPSLSEDTVCSLRLSDQGERRGLSSQMLTDSCSLQLAGSLCSLNKDLAGAR